jgi:4'-phosphopantetheinyl transferase
MPDARLVTRYRIRPGEAWVWAAAPDGRPRSGGPTLAETAGGVLSAGERAHLSRLCRAADRQSYAAAHALLRLLLSACVPGVEPGRWQFTASGYGRPELPPPWRRLRFNLSHTEGLVACIACLDYDCGIDVEPERGPQSPAFIRHVLAPAEQRAVLAAPEAARSRLFQRYWTLKEAYVKARGTGLSLPVERCEFTLAGGTAGAPRLISHPPDPRPDRWRFFQSEPTATHALAVAVRAAGEPLGADSAEQGDQLGDGVPVPGGADQAGLLAELLFEEGVGQLGLQDTLGEPGVDLPLADGELFWQVRLRV